VKKEQSKIARFIIQTKTTLTKNVSNALTGFIYKITGARLEKYKIAESSPTLIKDVLNATKSNFCIGPKMKITVLKFHFR